MYSIGVLCLLSVAVALPTPELLHTNLPAFPLPLELEADPPLLDYSINMNLKKPRIHWNLRKKPEAEKVEDILDDAIKVIQKESKESKESKDSKEKSEESKEPSEYNKDIEERPKEQKEEKKDSESEESKDRDEEEGSIIVKVIKKPDQKGCILNWLPSFSNFHLPWPLSYFAPKFRNRGQQPIYIVRESDFGFDDY